jgi:hypothetical protein
MVSEIEKDIIYKARHTNAVRRENGAGSNLR